jgi:hypothetical protein
MTKDDMKGHLGKALSKYEIFVEKATTLTLSITNRPFASHPPLLLPLNPSTTLPKDKTAAKATTRYD